MELTGQSIVGYKRGRSSSDSFCAFNPATGKGLARHFYSASSEETHEAVRLAADSFQTYRRLTGRKRGEFLRRIATNIEALGESLVERATQETALPAARIRGERA